MYYIITKNYIPGFHFWVDAPSDVAYLRHEHRHVFEITCKIKVGHGDRDIEIIKMQNIIQKYLLNKYGDQYGQMHLANRSCEMLAMELAYTFGCLEVTVQEDGQGGAGYVRE